MRRFFNWLGYGFLGFIAAGVILYVEPFLNTHAYQDNCAFGSVSNEDYRALLAEAERLNEIEPLEFDFSTPGSQERQEYNSQLLQDRVNRLVRTRQSLDEKTAALHAVMRSIGAEYRYTALDLEYSRAVFGRSARHSRIAYQFDVNRYGRFVLWPRWVLVTATTNLERGVGNLGEAPFRIVVRQPTIIAGGTKSFEQSPFGEHCPVAQTPEE